MATNQDKGADMTATIAPNKVREEEISYSWDRLKKQQPQCGFGQLGMCCRHCNMGPCNINPFGGEPSTGVCGATADTIAARHFGRMIAAGTAAHSDHGLAVVETFLAAAKGEIQGYQLKDELKLLKIAKEIGIEIGDREVKAIAIELGEKLLATFGSTNGEMPFMKLAPIKRQEIWKKLGILPRGVFREVAEMMNRTTMGVDQDYLNIIRHGSRTALANGWGGSMIATQLQDVLFGTPVPIVAEVDLGTMKPDHVNVVVHGHEPLLSEMIVAAAQDPVLIGEAQKVGAKGIALSGICCTANEILMRHGIPVAGNFLQQEMAISSGLCEAMVVDVQCIMQSLPKIAECFHTTVITTNPRGKMEGATHMEFDEHHALDNAQAIIRAAIANFPKRKHDQVQAASQKMELVAGFSHETINYLLGGLFRASYRPLNEAIISGRIRGIAGVVGCNHPSVGTDDFHVKMVKELIKNDVIVLQTGCSAISCAKAGLLTPEAAQKYAGAGLAEVCETVGIPPVLHMGACVDNTRILLAATAVVKEGGLGDDISDLPAAGAAPEWMSEKAISIGQYFVASGVYTIFGGSFPTLGAKKLTEYLFKGIAEETGGRWAFEPDPVKAAHLMIAHIDERRKALGIDKARERVLMDMATRRAMD